MNREERSPISSTPDPRLITPVFQSYRAKVNLLLARNQAAITLLLIEDGADVSAKDLTGQTSMHLATFHKAKAVAALLQKYDAS